jgi:ankyrin repeat protein
LHAAVQGGVVDPEIIKALIAKRADVNLQNKEGDTPLDAYIKQANTNNLSNVIEIINLLKKDATGATKQKAAELIRGGERFKKQEADLLLANLFSKVITDTLNKKIGNSDITEKIKEILGIPKGSKFGTKKKRSRRRSKRRSKRRSRIKKI